MKALMGKASDADVFDSAVVNLESRFSVNHHNNAKFFATGRTKRFGKGGGTFEPNMVGRKTAYH